MAAAVIALTGTAVLTTGPSGSATSAYGPGTFAFTQTADRGFSYHVYLSDTSGANRRLLTTRRAVGRPAVSPDGRQVAFAGPLTDDSDGRYGIYVINTDGTGLRLLTAPRFADFDPAWSPDGRAIAFTHDGYGNGRLSCCAIALMYADGRSAHVVPGTAYGLQPAWSADGHRLAYAAYDGLHAVNADGSAPVVLVRGQVSWPAWSPDGRRIAYVRGVTSAYSQVAVVGAAGGAALAVENLAARAESPVWAPDSTTLYYVLFHGAGDEGRTDSSVWRSQLASATPSRLFTYGVGLSANVYGLSFSGPPPLFTKPSAVSRGAGRLDVFVRGTDSALYQKAHDGTTWSGWYGLGGRIVGNPHAASPSPGQLDVYVRGTDSALYHKSYNGSVWSGWLNLGGRLAGDPQVVTTGQGRLDVYVRGTDSALYHKSYNGSAWSGWLDLGGRLAGDPRPVALTSGRLDVFVRGIDAALYSKSYDLTAWSGWVNLGGVLATDPAPASRGSGRIDVAVQGTDARLYVNSFDGGWTGFRSLVTSLAGEPEATSVTPGSVDITAVGSPPGLPLVHVRGGTIFGPVEQLPGPLGGTPDSVSPGGDLLDVFYRGLDGRLRHRSYDGHSWSGVEDLGGLLPPY